MRAFALFLRETAKTAPWVFAAAFGIGWIFLTLLWIASTPYLWFFRLIGVSA